MSTPARPKSWSRPLADFVGKAIDPVLAKQGFGESDIITYWPQVVGERMAGVSEPIRLQWPSRGSAPSPHSTKCAQGGLHFVPCELKRALALPAFGVLDVCCPFYMTQKD